MIEHDRLMVYPIPEVLQSYGPREIAFYALSIGVGRDPMDKADLRFVGAGEPVPFPTMALVLGHPGFWLADPATGVDATRLVHGGQSLTLHAPLLVRGTAPRSPRRRSTDPRLSDRIPDRARRPVGAAAPGPEP